MRKSFFTLIISILFQPNIHSQEGWFWQNPLPQGNDIYDICRDVSTGTYFACGDYGTLLSKKVDYSKWLAFQAPTQENLYSICFQNTHGWAVGYNGAIIHCEGDNLIKWHQQESGTEKMLLSVFFIDTQKGWAVGQDETILRTINGGQDWTNISGIGSQHYFSVYFLDENNGWLVGAEGKIFHTSNGGNTLKKEDSVTHNDLLAVDFFNSYSGYAVGKLGTVLKYLSGPYQTVWLDKSISTTNHLNAVFRLGISKLAWIAGANGTILYSYDGGENWYFQNSGGLSELRSLSFTDNGTGWIAGFDGVILKTEDGGGELTVSAYHRFALNIEIPDLGVASDILDVEASNNLLKILDDNAVSGVTVILDSIIHAHVSDLTLLLSHEGITDTLLCQVGEEGTDIINCDLSDASTITINEGEAPFGGSFKPHNPMSIFNGVNPIGEWTLSIYDDIEGNTGTLKAWGLKLYFDKVTDIINETPKIPAEFVLHQNYPNPFNPNTTIKYSIPNVASSFSSSMNVTLKFYDILGREVATLVNKQQRPGNYEVEWNPDNHSSGVYFYKIRAGEFIETKKMILLR